jgi:hypothetical protein
MQAVPSSKLLFRDLLKQFLRLFLCVGLVEEVDCPISMLSDGLEGGEISPGESAANHIREP